MYVFIALTLHITINLIQESLCVLLIIVDAEVIKTGRKWCKIIALRCAGFNNVDVVAAQKQV
jgi:D-lactate dehydrogenase